MDSKQTDLSDSDSSSTLDENIGTTVKPISGKDIVNIRMISGRSINSTNNSSSVVRPPTALKPTRAFISTVFDTSSDLNANTGTATGSSATATAKTMDTEPSTSSQTMLTTSTTKIAKTSKIKFLTLGAPKVGKTLLLRRMQNINWPLISNDNYTPTIGPDLHRLKCGTIEAIDIGGQERCITIARKYCELFNVFMIVFDIIDAESFLMARYWLDFITTEPSINAKRILLIGNKMDLHKQRKVSKNLAENMAMAYEAKYLEISAKMDLTMDKLLETLETDKSNIKSSI